MKELSKEQIKILGTLIWTLIGLLLTLYVLSFGFSYISWEYEIWAREKAGEAELAHAMYSKKVRTVEAEADKNSAAFAAEAEVIRAKGVAEANQIIGDSLRGNEAYLRYRWIEGLQTNQMQTVYIPTEAGLPILEARRLDQ